MFKELLFQILGYKKEYRFMSFIRYLQYFFFQRIIGINYHTEWPVHFSSMVSHPEKITFEDEIIPIGYSPGCYIQARNGIFIGKNVLIGPGVKIISANHDFTDFTKYTDNPPIKIGRNCWIGSNVTILPGVQLGEHVIVAANSVVTTSFLENNILIGGIPAKKIKDIKPYNGRNFLTGESL